MIKYLVPETVAELSYWNVDSGAFSKAQSLM